MGTVFLAEHVMIKRRLAVKILHADLKIGNSRLYVNDAMMGGKGPKSLGGSPAAFWLYVDDCDAGRLRDRGLSRNGRT